MFKFNSKNKNDFFETSNYRMKPEYNTKNLAVGRFCSVSNVPNEDGNGPIDKVTDQIYLFEKLTYNDGSIKYREVFTGFVSDTKGEYFNMPFVVDVEDLETFMPEFNGDTIPYLGFLLLLDSINSKGLDEVEHKLK